MVSTKLVTADDLLAMGSDAPYELLKGELIEVSPSSMESSSITSHLASIIDRYVFQFRSGLVTSAEGGYILQRDPDTVVAPDIGFIRKSRVPLGFDKHKFMQVPQDLAVEVLSPSNTTAEMYRKLGLYSAAGVPLVWVVYPLQKVVIVHHLGEPSVTLGESDMLSGGDILPGLTIAVSEVFESSLED